MTCEDAIRQVVHNNSGGVKMIKLIVELTAFEGIEPDHLSNIEAIISQMSDLDILVYTFNMGNNLLREKQFVYTV